MCAVDISLKLRIETDLTYEKAVIILTHVENDILAHEMNATLASTISSQYNRQSDLYLANSLQHDERINMIIGRKRRLRQPSRLEVMQQQRMYEDPNPVARMNRFGYDGPNRHQFGGNKSQFQRDIFTHSPTNHATRRCSLHPYHLAPPRRTVFYQIVAKITTPPPARIPT